MDMNKIDAWVLTKVDEVVAIFADGFQPWDIIKCVKIVQEAVTVAEELDTPAERRMAANKLSKLVLDKTDTPWFPDEWSDPMMQKGFGLAFDWLLPEEASDSTVQPE